VYSHNKFCGNCPGVPPNVFSFLLSPIQCDPSDTYPAKQTRIIGTLERIPEIVFVKFPGPEVLEI